MKRKLYAVITPEGDFAMGAENFDGWGGLVSGSVFCTTREDADKVCKWWNAEAESGHKVVEVDIAGVQTVRDNAA